MKGVGFVFLFLSSLSLLLNTEAALNAIFHAKAGRPVHARMATYLVLMVVGPVALSASLVASALWRQGDTAFFTAVAPFCLSTVAFGVLYRLLPNTRVDARAALVAAVLTAVVWETAKHVFTFASARLFSFGRIYGALGAIPVFLLWLWVSWMVAFVGARIAYAIQASRHPQREVALDDPWARQLWATRLVQALGAGPASIDSLAAAVEAHPDGLEVLLELLCSARVAARSGDNFFLQPGADSLTLADVRRAVVPWPELGGDTLLAIIGEAEREAERRLTVRLRELPSARHGSGTNAAV